MDARKRMDLQINTDMDIKKINELMAHKEWTAMLGALSEGTHTLQFENVLKIRSCKAVAYDINSNHTGRTYYFKVNKKTLTVIITVIGKNEDGE